MSLWTLLPLCAHVGEMKGENEQFWVHILVLCQSCQSVREGEGREGEKVRWGDLGERWRWMRRGVQELKWPCGPDADKLSTLSTLAFICLCHAATFDPFLLFCPYFSYSTSTASSFLPVHFPLPTTYISLPLLFVSSHAFTQLWFFCIKKKKTRFSLYFCSLNTPLYIECIIAISFISRGGGLFCTTATAKRRFVSCGANVPFVIFWYFLVFCWNILSGYTWPCWQDRRHFQYKGWFDNRLQMMFWVWVQNMESES